MEVAARLGGGHDAELFLAALGVDLAALAVLAALGEPPSEDELRRGHDRPALVRFLVAPPGVVERVDGVARAAAVPGVLDVLAYRGPGDVIEPLFFFSSRRRHTSCGREWSSDVCSSDLIIPSPFQITRLIKFLFNNSISFVFFKTNCSIFIKSDFNRN